MGLEDGNIHENHSIVTEVNGYKYIFFSVPFTSKFYFIIYHIDDETIVLDKVKQRVTELSIPPRDIPFEEIKTTVKNLTGDGKKRDAIYVGITVITLGVASVVGYKLFLAKPKSNVSTLLPTNIAKNTPSKPQPPPTFSPIQEHYALALAEYQCFINMDDRLQKLHSNGVIVRQISINTLSTPQNATCSYTFTEDYTYPAVGTTLNGRYYEKTSTKTITVTYQDFLNQEQEIPLLIQNADFLKCLSFLKKSHFILQSRPSVLQADFVFRLYSTAPNNSSIPSVNLYKMGQFFYDLEALCGYNININNVQISPGGIGGTFVLNWNSNSASQTVPTFQQARPVNTSYTPSVPTSPSNTSSQPQPTQPTKLLHTQLSSQGMHPLRIQVQVVPAQQQHTITNTK